MAKVKFKVACTAVYNSELEVPNKIVNDEKAVLEYIQTHLDECNVQDLEWLNDLDAEEAVTAEDIRYIEDNIVQVRATNIAWHTDENDNSGLPTIVIIPDEYALDSEYDEESLADVVSDWLSDEFDFCHEGFELEYLTDDDLKREEEKLKRAICNAGVDAIEDFLGHPLDSDDIDIESEMNGVLAQIPDDEYLKYLAKYCR